MKHIKKYENLFTNLFNKSKDDKSIKNKYIIIKWYIKLTIAKVESEVLSDLSSKTIMITYSPLYKFINGELIKIPEDRNNWNYLSDSGGLKLILYRSDSLKDCKKIISTFRTLKEEEKIKADATKYNL